MKQSDPLSLARLAGAGFTVVGTLVVGLVLGMLAAKLLHWGWAIPVGIVLGFIAGMLSMFRQLSQQM